MNYCHSISSLVCGPTSVFISSFCMFLLLAQIHSGVLESLFLNVNFVLFVVDCM